MRGPAALLALAAAAAPGAAAFKLVIDCNTMSPDDLRKAASGRLAANGSYSLFENYNFSGSFPPPSDELLRSYLKGVGTELAFTEEDGWPWESDQPAQCVCTRPGPGGSLDKECGCQTYRRLTGRPPTAALGYTESMVAGENLMTDAQIDAQAAACRSPVIVMTRSFCGKDRSTYHNADWWVGNTTRALKHKHVYGVAMEYTPVPEPGGGWQGCGMVDLMKLALSMNKSALLLWPVYSNNRHEPAWQNVADSIQHFRDVGAPIDDDRVVVVLAM